MAKIVGESRFEDEGDLTALDIASLHTDTV